MSINTTDSLSLWNHLQHERSLFYNSYTFLNTWFNEIVKVEIPDTYIEGHTIPIQCFWGTKWQLLLIWPNYVNMLASAYKICANDGIVNKLRTSLNKDISKELRPTDINELCKTLLRLYNELKINDHRNFNAHSHANTSECRENTIHINGASTVVQLPPQMVEFSETLNELIVSVYLHLKGLGFIDLGMLDSDDLVAMFTYKCN